MGARNTLAIRLLGRLDVRAGGVPIRIGGRHAQALTALLALRPRPRLRDTLAAELWPEAGVPSAASLRQALWLIRSSLTTAGVDADRWLVADQDTIGLHPDAVIDLDADRFERLAASACRTYTRTSSPRSRSSAWSGATFRAPDAPQASSSSAIHCARRPTPSSSRSTASPDRGPRSFANTAGSAPSSGPSSR
jgi:hypothetical protein